VLQFRDVYPRSRILIFIHPGSQIQQQQQKRRGKKFVVLTIFVAKNITELKIIKFLDWKRKIVSQFKKNYRYRYFLHDPDPGAMKLT
jgi:hypothetical protein